MTDRICTHDDCGMPHRSRGLCQQRYWQYRRARALPPITLLERFEQKIEAGPGGCWLWTGATVPAGYGQKWDGERVVVAHRWSYEHHIGPIPDGLVLDHLCRVRRCVNPWHLEPVTTAINTQRGKSGEINGGRMRARTHCPYGHEFSPENTYVSPARGDRQCRSCKRARDKVANDIQMGLTPLPAF